MAYKIRVILDVEDDVFRDIIVHDLVNLEDLHFTISKSFGFKGQEMASFYRSNQDWEQGEEIPLFDMSEDGSAPCMQNTILKEVLKFENDKLIYVYDFFNMWTFYIELNDVNYSSETETPFILLSFGEAPEEAPEKEFIGEDSNDDFDIFDSEDGFDNIDDIDLDQY
jgi:hypothetical protein